MAPAENCLRCQGPLPPHAGPGRPRKYCKRCKNPVPSEADWYPRKPPAPEAQRVLQLTDPEPTVQRVDGAVIEVANPHGLDAAGLALFEQYKDEPLSPIHRRLLIEGCRLADRAEKFHRILRGDARTWAAMRIDEEIREVAPDVPEIHVKIIVTSMVQEARNTAATLKALITELRTALRQSGAGESDADPLDGLLDEVAAKREQRGAS